MFDIEFLDIPPLRSAGGTVRLPGSKSISNRVLLLAALSQGQTTVHDLLASDDTAVMLAALKQLGCSVQQDGETAIIGGLATYPLTAIGALVIGVIESFATFFAREFKEAIVFLLVIPVLLALSLSQRHAQEDE